jgi:hypothetical protein
MILRNNSGEVEEQDAEDDERLQFLPKKRHPLP